MTNVCDRCRRSTPSFDNHAPCPQCRIAAGVCREAHNKMLLRRSIALDCLRNTLPPIDEDQRLTLLHAPFKGTTLFGGKLAKKLQEANTKPAATFAVFPTPAAPPVSYSSRQYVR